MKKLLIDQINFDDPVFLKENEDVMPEEFFVAPEAFIWFLSIIKSGTIKKDLVAYPKHWFLFDKDDRLILTYNKNTQHISIYYNTIWCVLINKFGISGYNKINKLFKPMLEQVFNLKVGYINTLNFSWFIENHFNSKK